jgi:hypothetical protein
VLKKFLSHPLLCSCYVVIASLLYLRVAGPPRHALGLLGALALVGLSAVAVFLAVAEPTYRPDAPDGLGTLATLVFALGMTVIAFALASWAFGGYAELAYAGSAFVAVLTGLAAASARRGRDT